MKNLYLTRPLAFIDVETTGLNTQKERIVEISVIKIHPNGSEELLSSMINPCMPIPVESTKIHGITDNDVHGKPTFQEFAPQVFEFIKDCDLAGFGIYKFDLLVLEAEFRRAGMDYSRKGKQIVDVQSIYHKLEPRDLSAAYARYCNKKLEGAHRAHVDARATMDVLESQLELHKDLPRDIGGLREFYNPRDPSWIDDDGKFAWADKNVVVNFGAHRGEALEHVSKNSPDYLQWMIGEDFSPEVKKIAEEAIKGKFPQPTQKIP